MNNKLQVLLPLIVLGAASLMAWQIMENPSTAQKQTKASETRLTVKVAQLSAEDFTPIIESYGEISAAVSGTLVAEVSGKLEFLSPALKPGGVFKKGEKLAQIDPRFYRAELVVAEAALATAKFKLEEEIALGQQAEANWLKIGKSSEATSLALRKPHLIAAKAQVRSAEAGLDKAQLNLEKTSIFAPYDGKVVKRYVDEGQYLAANVNLADIFAASALEVRLPVSLNQFGFLAPFEDSKGSNTIQLSAQQGLSNHTWTARLVAVDHALDPQSKQLHLTAQVNPNHSTVKSNALKIGQFVQARIKGQKLEQVFVIPRTAVYQNQFVYVSEQERLVKKVVTILWSDDLHAVVKTGLAEGDLIVLTPLGSPISGTLLSIELADSSLSQQSEA